MRHEWENGPRRNTSSNKLGTTPMYILIIKVKFQEVPVTKTCIVNDDGDSKISKGKLLPPH